MTREVVAEAQDQRPLLLRELDFTDLYLSESGSEAKMRGLIDVDDPIYPVPLSSVADLHDVHRKVVSMGQTDDEFVLDHDKVRYRVAKIDSDSGTAWYAMRRSLDPIPRLSSLLQGVHPGVIQELGRLGKRPGRGLVLMSGATGSGKTTTICSLLQAYLTTYGDVATTIEDPPELRLDGAYRNGAGHCFQVKVVDGDFARPLKKTLRYNPRYILIGELRDPEGAAEALRAAISGHIVLATIHAGTIPEALQSLMKLVSARLDLDLAKQMMADGMACVLHQELRRFKVSDDRVERRVKLRYLFLGDPSNGASAGLRQKIREGKVQNLGDDIDAQAVRIGKGEPPLALLRTGGR